MLVYIFASTLTDGGDFSGRSSVNREGARWLEGGFHADESNPPHCDAASARASVLKACLSLCSWREVVGVVVVVAALLDKPPACHSACD